MWPTHPAVPAQPVPRKGLMKTGTLVKALAGLALLTVCAGYWLTGGTVVNPSDSTTQPPTLRNHNEKVFMLELINQARAEAGVPPVVMGTNHVAQIQAENLLRDCTLSHWGTDGLKPHHRYSLSGGYQVNKETATTANECGLLYTWLQWNDDSEEMLRESVDSLLSSPIHRGVMLSPAYQQVNIGLAWDRTIHSRRSSISRGLHRTPRGSLHSPTGT